MSIFRRMTINTFLTVMGIWPLLLYLVPKTRDRWLEFGVLCLFFAFLLAVLFSQNRLTAGCKPKAPGDEVG